MLRNLVDQRQQTIVMVTHDPSVAAKADRVIHLSDGFVEQEVVVSEEPPYDVVRE